MREFELLQHIFAASRDLGGSVLIPPGDDMALLRLGGGRLLAAVDQLVAGRHFDLGTTPLDLVGRKAVSRALSDIAAMAARPLATLAAVALPPDFGDERAKRLFDAMRSTADHYRCPLVGGDIAIHGDRTHPLLCTVTVLAEPAATPPITRAGATVGDVVYVTGTLGGSFGSDGRGRHLTFEPRIDEALELAERLGTGLHAMLDISDGLGRDASHIAALSGVGIEIDADRVPRPEGIDWRRALGEGEDYELCFTAAGRVPGTVGDVAVTAVGRVVPREAGSGPLVLVREGGRTLAGDDLGWQHGS